MSRYVTWGTEHETVELLLDRDKEQTVIHQLAPGLTVEGHVESVVLECKTGYPVRLHITALYAKPEELP